MIPMIILMFILFLIFCERFFFLHKGHIRAKRFIDGIKNLLDKQRLLEALTVCEGTPGPVALIVKTGLIHHTQSETWLRSRIQALALVEIPTLERRISAILAIANIAPMLGLLGTILAFSQAFLDMQSLGSYANISQFSYTIIPALTASACGIALSCVGHIAYHFLHGRVRSIIHDMEYAAHKTLEFIYRSDTPFQEKA